MTDNKQDRPKYSREIETEDEELTTSLPLKPHHHAPNPSTDGQRTPPQGDYGRDQLETDKLKSIFYIATEGEKTEPDYFRILAGFAKSGITIKLPPKEDHDHKKSDVRGPSPNRVLARMKKMLKENNFITGDEAWLVIDRDDWPDTEIEELNQWAKTDKRFGFALSNPNFDYWLLLHIQDSFNSSTDDPKKYAEALGVLVKELHLRTTGKRIGNRHLNNYTPANIHSACQRARAQCGDAIDWPRELGQTTVHRLVERILPHLN